MGERKRDPILPMFHSGACIKLLFMHFYRNRIFENEDFIINDIQIIYTELQILKISKNKNQRGWGGGVFYNCQMSLKIKM